MSDDQARGAFHHIDLSVRDVAASKRVYGPVLEFLGYTQVKDDPGRLRMGYSRARAVRRVARYPRGEERRHARRLRAGAAASRVARGQPRRGRPAPRAADRPRHHRARPARALSANIRATITRCSSPTRTASSSNWSTRRAGSERGSDSRRRVEPPEPQRERRDDQDPVRTRRGHARHRLHDADHARPRRHHRRAPDEQQSRSRLRWRQLLFHLGVVADGRRYRPRSAHRADLSGQGRAARDAAVLRRGRGRCRRRQATRRSSKSIGRKGSTAGSRKASIRRTW